MTLAGPPRSHENELPSRLFSHQCLEKLFGNSELIPNRGYEAAKRGQRSPDRLPLGAKEECSRHLLLFSKQFRKGLSANFALTEFSEVRSSSAPARAATACARLGPWP